MKLLHQFRNNLKISLIVYISQEETTHCVSKCWHKRSEKAKEFEYSFTYFQMAFKSKFNTE